MTYDALIEEDSAAAQPVPNAVFRLDDIAGKERYDLWKESISCIFEVDGERDMRDESFSAQVDANMFGPVMLARTLTLGQKWKRTPSVMARDGMDHYMVQLYERGQMQWEDHAGLRDLPENGLVIFDLAQEAETVTNSFANISLIIPRDMLDGALKSQNDQHLRTLSGEEPMVKLLRDHMMSLKMLASQMTQRQAIEIAPATVGLTAACLNAAIDQEAPDQTSGVAMAHLTMIRRFIEANLSDPNLSAEWIASRVGASRSKLYQLFDVFGGVGTYIRDRRLRRALLALTDERSQHRPIYDIALASGYTSDAAFSRAFRSRYGIAPRDIRNKKGQADTMHRLTSELDRRYERWLHHLSI